MKKLKISELTTKEFLSNPGAVANSYVLINYEDNTTEAPVTYKATIDELGKAIANNLQLYKADNSGNAYTMGVSQGAYTNNAAKQFVTAAEKTKIANAVTDISGKVDKVTGKGLSTNDYTDADQTKVAAVPPTNLANNPKYVMAINGSKGTSLHYYNNSTLTKITSIDGVDTAGGNSNEEITAYYKIGACGERMVICNTDASGGLGYYTNGGVDGFTPLPYVLYAVRGEDDEPEIGAYFGTEGCEEWTTFDFGGAGGSTGSEMLMWHSGALNVLDQYNEEYVELPGYLAGASVTYTEDEEDPQNTTHSLAPVYVDKDNYALYYNISPCGARDLSGGHTLVVCNTAGCAPTFGYMGTDAYGDLEYVPCDLFDPMNYVQTSTYNTDVSDGLVLAFMDNEGTLFKSDGEGDVETLGSPAYYDLIASNTYAFFNKDRSIIFGVQIDDDTDVDTLIGPSAAGGLMYNN